MSAAHYRLPKTQPQGQRPLYQVNACNSAGFSTPDVQAVTCLRCQSTEVYRVALAVFNDVVDALSYPKEEHPCLKPNP